MTPGQARTERLHRLIDLARTTRGWSRAQLARHLHRDPTKVYPDSGNPKSDFVVALAKALDWPVGAVLETIWNGSGSGAAAFVERKPSKSNQPDKTFELLYSEAREAHDDGRYRDMVDLASRMYSVAESDERRAFSCAMEASGWDGLGRYTQEVDACRRGLATQGISTYTRNILRSTLANAWYSLWDLEPALGTAELLANHYQSHPPERDVDQKRVAFVHYLRGNIRRRFMAVEPDQADHHRELALVDLTLARDAYRELSDSLRDHQLAGIANTCEAAITECLCHRGDTDSAEAVDRILERVDQALSVAEQPRGDWLESWGWNCIFATNIAMRSLQGAALQTRMKPLLEYTLDIAESLDHWAMRERAYSMQLCLHRTLSEQTGLELVLNIDEMDQTLIAATMARFPAFQQTGWSMLESASSQGRSGGLK
jgi:tetratricopeptide (TPR) repeat protein